MARFGFQAARSHTTEPMRSLVSVEGRRNAARALRPLNNSLHDAPGSRILTPDSYAAPAGRREVENIERILPSRPLHQSTIRICATHVADVSEFCRAIRQQS